jgi:tetratricopeptide (TPR) repeat protein
MNARSRRLWERGMAHFAAGNLVAAQAAFEAMLAIDPGSPPALFRLSVLQASLGRFQAALALAQRAQERDPERGELLAHVARCLLMTGRTEAARATATRALALPREGATLLDGLGAIMARLEEQTLAIEMFDQAIALQPESAGLHFNRALAEQQFGLRESAERDLEACIALNPAHGKAHFALAEMQPRGPLDNHVERLRAQLQLASPGSAQEEFLSLSLFRELDDLGRYEEAWPMLARGIASRRARWPAAPRHPRAISDALLHAGGESVPAPAPARSAIAPLFVIGMPGSGVSLLGKLLGRHSKVHPLGGLAPFARMLSQAIGRETATQFGAADIKRFPGVDFAALGCDYLAAVGPASGGRGLLVCESRPMNFQLAPFIARALPNARFLHVTRDPVDNCVSILAHPWGETSLPQHEPGRLASAYLDYRHLMLRWGELLPGRIMDVSYESLVERPETVLRVVCGSIGLRYGSALRTGLMLHTGSIGRGARYLGRLPALKALA